MAPSIRLAVPDDVDTIVRILIASKEASFPDTIDDHDRDVEFWTRRWRGYISSGSRAQQSLGDGWVFLAERDGVPVGYVAYHRTRRHGTDAELQNIYVLKEAQGQGIGAHLLGVVAHRLHADGSRSMCVGFDENSPYKRFHLKYGAVEIQPGGPWAIWKDVAALAARVPAPAPALMADLRQPRNRGSRASGADTGSPAAHQRGAEAECSTRVRSPRSSSPARPSSSLPVLPRRWCWRARWPTAGGPAC